MPKCTNFLSFKEPKKKMFLKIAAQLSEAGDFPNPERPVHF